MRVEPIGFRSLMVLGALGVCGLLALGVAGTPNVVHAQKASNASKVNQALPQGWVDEIPWRNIGPANMSGRIVDLAVNPNDSSQWWAATASGGLLRTDNNGATFEHQFDKEATVSIGAFDLAPSDPNILWVGTGEENPRNSSSWGDGVYKSTDGGKSWKNMGLNKIFQTGAVVIHPTNPDVVFVGALGRLWGPSEDRGLYKTTDGGKSWNKVLYVDDKTGVIDLVISPADPNIMLAATYTRMRDGFDGNDPATKFGSGAGIWRSTDGGETWERMSEGLPKSEFGRVGICFYEKDPNFVYAVIESKRIGQWPETSPYVGIRGENSGTGAKLTEVTKDGPAEKAGLLKDDIVLQVDDAFVLSYNDFLGEVRRHNAGDTVAVTVARDGDTLTVNVELAKRPDVAEDSEKGSTGDADQEGEKDEEAEAESENAKLDALRRDSPFAQSLGGQNANLTDQQGPEGNDFGGIYRSSDAGVTWTRINTVNPRPMYYSKICVDPSDNNYIWVLGTALYISKDGGETFTGDGASSEVHTDHHAMWIDPRDGRHVILGCDGGIYVTYDRGKKWDHHNHFAIGQFYHVGVDTNRAYNVYGGLQDNGSWGGPSMVRDGRGPVNTDWFRIGGGDGFICLVDPDDPNQLYYESQNGSMGRRNLATGESGSIRPRPPRGVRYRFNWKTPFILSPHNSEIHFSAGNYVFRSVKKGDSLQPISPEITRTSQGSGSAIGQSPVDENVLYVGTTDGMLWGTKDGGQNWTDLWKDAQQVPATALTDASTGRGQGRGFRGGQGGGARGVGRGPGGGRRANTMAAAETETEPPSEAKSEEITEDKDVAKPEGKMEAEAETKSENEEKSEAKAEEKPAVETSEDKPAEPAATPPAEDLLSGTWTAKFESEMMPAERSQFKMTFKRSEDGTYAGEYESAQAGGELSGGKFDAESGKLTVNGTTGGGDLLITATLNDGKLSGTMEVNDGAFSIPFAGTKSSDATTLKADAAQETKSATGKPLKDLLPKQMWVSSIEPSKFVGGRCYVTIDGHRADVDGAFVLVTENYGKTWERLDASLPTGTGSARVIREDLENRDLLYLGTEFGLFTSNDRGSSWTKFGNLPTVAVHEVAQHPTAGEIIVGTHGRSIWIADVTALRQFKPSAITEMVSLYAPAKVVRWRSMAQAADSGTRRFVGENPSSDAQIFYSLAQDVREIELEIRDLAGRVVQRIDAPGSKGLHKITWNLRRRGGNSRFAPRAENGEYLVALIVNGKTYTQTLTIDSDPDYQTSGRAENEAELIEALNAAEED